MDEGEEENSDDEESDQQEFPNGEYKFLVNYHCGIFNISSRSRYNERHIEYSFRQISRMLIHDSLCSNYEPLSELIRQFPIMTMTMTHDQICQILCHRHGHPQYKLLIKRITRPVDMGYGLFTMQPIDKGCAGNDIFIILFIFGCCCYYDVLQ